MIGNIQSLFKVTFEESKGKPLLDSEIKISAVSSVWNDFTYKIRCEFRVLSKESGASHSGDMLIGILAPKNIKGGAAKDFMADYRSLQSAVELLNENNTPKSSDSIRFFTMLPNMNSYRKLVDALGPEETQKFLSAVNDLVYFKDKSCDWFTDATDSDVFSLGFMRNSEAFFAYSNADSLIDGVEEEIFSGISQNLHLQYSLEGFENQHQIKLIYDSKSCIPKRINVLIGKNGLGKSQALRSFCRASLQYQDKNISIIDSNSSNRPMINRLLAIATPGETQNTFPPERKKTQKLFYRRLSLTRNSKTKTTRSVNELLVQLARSDERIGNALRWNLFCKSIATVLPLDNIVVTLKDKRVIPIKYLNKFGGEQDSLTCWAGVDPKSEPRIRHSTDLHQLSSGQLTFFKFSLLCCLYIENGSFVLLDEPETHMHPNMISDFVELLDTLLQETGSLALIATHSAYFVREVSREQVHIFSTNENNSISITSPRLRTFGADVESISQFIFNENIENRLTEKIFKQVKHMSFEQVEKLLKNELSMAALMEIKDRLEAK